MDFYLKHKKEKLIRIKKCEKCGIEYAFDLRLGPKAFDEKRHCNECGGRLIKK